MTFIVFNTSPHVVVVVIVVRDTAAATAAASAVAAAARCSSSTENWGIPVSCIKHQEMSLYFNMFLSLSAYRVDRKITLSLQLNDDDDVFCKDS